MLARLLHPAVSGAVFYSGLALLFTHELDAMPQHEWRVLPLLRSLPDEMAESVFLWAHVPIFAVVIAFVASLNPRIRTRTRALASGFLVLHGLLHWAYSGHTEYEFASASSNLLIAGAALLGLLYLLLVTARRHVTR